MAQFPTDAYIQRLLSLSSDDIAHVAVSDGAAPKTNDTKLSAEYDRIGVVDPLLDGNTLVLDGFFSETEAVGTITGWGVFGNGATGSQDSGTLFAATSANIEKTNQESLSLSAEITIRRVSS